MAMQSHHLHTHGPQPLYMQITVEEYEALKNENRALKVLSENAERWHHIDECLPEEDQYVLCCNYEDSANPGYDVMMVVSRTLQGGFVKQWFNGHDYLCIDDVTHWMYLPKHPENAKNNGKRPK